jgi:hypothetical protein
VQAADYLSSAGKSLGRGAARTDNLQTDGKMAALDGSILAALALAGVVLGAYGAALGLSGRRRARAAMERLAKVEEASRLVRDLRAQRARLSAYLEPEIEVRWFLAIRNEGHGVARDFTVSLDGRPLEQSPLIDPQQVDVGSLSLVPAHSSLRIPLRIAEHPERLRLELSWSDASQEIGLYQVELTR